jgi:hypothetical protein
MLEAALNKMLHSASTRLRTLAADPGSRAELEQATAALKDLFDLEPPSAAGLDLESRRAAESPGELGDSVPAPAPGPVREAS